MRTSVCSLLLPLVAFSWLAAAGAEPPAKKTERQAAHGIPVDPQTAEVLKRSAEAGYYGKPDLPLRQERNYARTPVDVEPYGGVKP